MASKRAEINKLLYNEKFLIAFDLDGTLLNSDSKLSKTTISSIKKVSKAGHHVCLITGRPYDGSICYHKQLGLDTIMVNQNGCFMSKPGDKTYVPICIGWSREILRKLIENKEFMEYASHIIIEGMGKSWLWDESDDDQVNDMMRELFHLDGRDVTCINKKFDKVSTDISTLICVIENEEDLNRIIYQVKNTSPNLIVRNWSMPHSGKVIIEINTKFATKATAIDYLASYYGIPNERCVAFGDGDNDVEMLTKVTWSFALKNASPAARLAARYMTKYNNDEDGAAKQLLKFLNIE